MKLTSFVAVIFTMTVSQLSFGKRAPNTPFPEWDHLPGMAHLPGYPVSISWTDTTDVWGVYATSTWNPTFRWYEAPNTVGFITPPCFSKDWPFQWTPSDPAIGQAVDVYIYNPDLSPKFAFQPGNIFVFTSPYPVEYTAQGMWEYNIGGSGV